MSRRLKKKVITQRPFRRDPLKSFSYQTSAFVLLNLVKIYN